MPAGLRPLRGAHLGDGLSLAMGLPRLTIVAPRAVVSTCLRRELPVVNSPESKIVHEFSLALARFLARVAKEAESRFAPQRRRSVTVTCYLLPLVIPSNP